MCALSADHDRVPSIDSPLDAVGAVDAALTAGGAVGLLTHVVGPGSGARPAGYPGADRAST